LRRKSDFWVHSLFAVYSRFKETRYFGMTGWYSLQCVLQFYSKNFSLDSFHLFSYIATREETMAEKRIKRAKPGRKFKAKTNVPFTKRNYQLFGIAIALLIVGYIALAQGPADSFWSLTLAPILLVIGYCVVIPVAIIFSKKNNQVQKPINDVGTKGG
jgi:hypothetical protein